MKPPAKLKFVDDHGLPVRPNPELIRDLFNEELDGCCAKRQIIAIRKGSTLRERADRGEMIGARSSIRREKSFQS